MREYYTIPRHKDELPIGTHIQIIEWNGNYLAWHGKTGIVKGYFTSEYEITGGWHCIQFDDEPTFSLALSPYVNRVYLKEIEKALINES